MGVRVKCLASHLLGLTLRGLLGEPEPAAGAVGVCFGPRLLATAADLHARLGVPYAKTADFLGAMIEEPITAGALCQNLLRVANLAEPAYRDLIGQLRLAMVVHADETGWRIGTLNAWLWVFTNQDATVYLMRSGEGARGHEAITEILGESFAGVLVSDCFSAYDKDRLAEWFTQKCAVPPTNNHAERMIRLEVVARKTEGCNKSKAGAAAHAVLGSIPVTGKQRGRSPVSRLVQLVRQRAGPT